MELIKCNSVEIEEYAALLVERDRLLKESASIRIRYIQVFGKLISDAYQEMVECIRLKKTIAYYQAAVNRGSQVDRIAMEKYLEQEMASYQENLNAMLEDQQLCMNAGRSSDYEVTRAKTLYRRLVKKLHPDLHPETDSLEVLRELWHRIVAAYEVNDVKSLSELEVLVDRALADNRSERSRIYIPDITDRMKELKDEIYRIMRSEPYLYREILIDNDKVQRKKKELLDELDSYQKYRNQLEEVIRSMGEKGGLANQ